MTRAISNNPVTFRALIPKKLNINGMSAPIRDACIKDALAMGKDFEKVIRTWKGEVPRIQTEAKTVPSGTPPYPMFHTGFTASAWPREDGSKGYWKWRWLDLGTKVRYAVMSKPFVPKTRKGQLNSWVGKGKMLFVSKKHPMPGIKARRFTLALRKKWEGPFKQHIQTAVAKGVKASGHAM
jgi:hypothetical protein